jgi:hypothetical protein
MNKCKAAMCWFIYMCVCVCGCSGDEREKEKKTSGKFLQCFHLPCYSAENSRLVLTTRKLIT